MKKFFLAAALLATALFLAGLALTCIIAIYSWGQDAYERREAKPYETIKEWSLDLRTNIGLLIQAKTKVVGRESSYCLLSL